MSKTITMTDEQHKLFYELVVNRKPKMTREEAIRKCQPLIVNADRAINLADCLEALGLIKFEEAEFDDAIMKALSHCRVSYYKDTDFIIELAKLGYQIVKKS